MFQCLEKSGLNPGKKGDLSGFKYKTEHIGFRLCNFLILMSLGYKPLVDDGKGKYQVVDLFSEKPNVLQPIPYRAQDRMYQFFLQMRDDNIQLLKDPQAAPAMREWISRSKTFANAKYVWMRRDPLKTAKSFVRLKVPRMPQYRGLLTTRKAKRIYEDHEMLWGQVLSGLNHIEVRLEDFLTNTGREAKRISKFIGRDLDTSLVNKKETFDGGQKFFVEADKNDTKSFGFVWNPQTGLVDERRVVQV